MAKSYTDELAAWVRERTAPGRDRNLVAFYAVKDDVKQALDAGYAVKTIWAHMKDKGRIQFGYETFLSYVHRVLKAPRTKPGSQSGEVLLAQSEDGRGNAAARFSKAPSTVAADPPSTNGLPPAIPSFHFTPLTPD